MPSVSPADFGAADPIIPRCCCCGATPGQGTLSQVHLRPTSRFPFLWLYRGRPPRSWWRFCLAVLRPDPADPEADRRYLCPACLPLARAVPLPDRAPTLAPPTGADTSAAPQAVRWPAPGPAAAPLSHDTGLARIGASVEQYILSLRQVFSRDAMVAGVTGEGHRGIELTRGAASVRCRACGQEIAHVVELAGGALWDDPHYEYTLAGLCACPATRSVAG